MSNLDRTPTEILDFLESLGIGDNALEAFRWSLCTRPTIELSSCDDFRTLLATAPAKAQRKYAQGLQLETTRIYYIAIVADDLMAIHVCHSGRDCWHAKAVTA